MFLVWMTALGVGGATIIGTVMGFLFRHSSTAYEQPFLSLAGGIMLAAALFGFIVPICDMKSIAFLSAISGFILGIAVLLTVEHYADKFCCRISTVQNGNISKSQAITFALCIAIHNLPEGLAAGLSFACDDRSALLICSGIALQNLPEGMVTVFPLLRAGFTVRTAYILAVCTGLAEIIGTWLGYLIISGSTWILPAALGFAGGTMLFIIFHQMLPEKDNAQSELSSCLFLFGFCLLMIVNRLLIS